MIIHTKYFGELEIDQLNPINFPLGILGFEEYKEYVHFQMPGNEKFHCLQSVDEIDVAFMMIKPWDFFSDYETDISEEELNTIKVQSIDQIAVFNILTIPDNVNDTTANLLAPVIIHVDTQEGMQIVLKEELYLTKHRIFAEA